MFDTIHFFIFIFIYYNFPELGSCSDAFFVSSHLSPSFLSQTLVKLNPKLQPMLETIQANRANWEELNRKRQRGQSVSAPASPCSSDITEAIGCAVTKTGSTPCCSADADSTACKPVS